MKIFYLNCFRLLKNNEKQRNWLFNYVKSNDVDVVCLAESSNFDFGALFPDDVFKYRYRSETPIGKQGWKFYICSKIPVEFHPINYPVPDILEGTKDQDVLIDYCTDTMINMKFNNGYEIVPVHIQCKAYNSKSYTKGNAHYEDSLEYLLKHMIGHNPIVVFGDFNNYKDDKSFLALTDNTGYRNAKSAEIQYTYKNNPDDPGSLIDHTFTNSSRVCMEYIPTIEQGFNHHGMLISIK